MSCCHAGAEAHEIDTLSFADEAEQNGEGQSWPGLFWMPPADDEPAERDMLRLHDELAGLIAAADMPADQDRTHITKPRATVSAPGELEAAFSRSAAAVSIRHFGQMRHALPSGMLCHHAAVLCCVVLCVAVLHICMPYKSSTSLPNLCFSD